MTITVTCGKCRKNYQVKDALAGRRVKCPACSSSIAVPEPPKNVSPIETTNDEGVYAIASDAKPMATDKRDAPPALASSRPPTDSRKSPLSIPGQPVSASPEVMAQLLAGFQGTISPRHLSPLYLVGVLFTTLIMISLPLIYVGLIGAVCWGVYWHLDNNVGMLSLAHGGRAAIFLLLVYVAPAVIGGILILFMIKPLFAPPAEEGRRRSFTRKAEPVLFALVDKICEVVGAPVPKRINLDCQVNASASLDGGWLRALVKRELVLTIGMPLAAGLSLEQFVGVLAHEFGHFSQGVGMRLTYVVRSINFWFLRVAYQRDAWDVWLAGSTEDLDLRIAWILLLAQLCVWITRKVLLLLMILGHLVAGFMLRQMELDADDYEIRLVGSKVFEATARRLALLSAAYQGAQVDAVNFYRQSHLPDDLPKLMLANIEQIPSLARTKLDEAIDGAKTSLFDSHPADKDRIAAARRAAAEGVFRCTLPTDCLFRDFPATTRNVTYDFFCEAIGKHLKPNDLHPVEELLAQQQDTATGS